MKELLRFTLYPGQCVSGASYSIPEALFSECIAKWPQFHKMPRNAFDVEVERDSQLMHEIFDYLKNHAGKAPNWNHWNAVMDVEELFSVSGRRIFDMNDIKEAEYFDCWPAKNIVVHAARRDDGNLYVKRSEIRKQPIGRGLGQLRTMCSGEMRSKFESEKFSQIQFNEVYSDKDGSALEGLFEISSKLSMPAVKNAVIDQFGNPVDSDSKGCYIKDLYHPWYLQFDRAHVQAMGEFDVAITSERWGGGVFPRRTPRLICSKRFKHWCDGQKLKIQWFPVGLV